MPKVSFYEWIFWVPIFKGVCFFIKVSYEGDILACDVLSDGFWPFGISRLNYLLMFLQKLDLVHILFEVLRIIFYFLFPFGLISTITDYKKRTGKKKLKK